MEKREDPLTRPEWQLHFGRMMARFIQKASGRKIERVLIEAEAESKSRYKITVTGADGSTVLEKVIPL